MHIEAIENALRGGSTLQADTNASGMRFVVVKKNDKTLGIGCGKDFDAALEEAEKDVLAGHQPKDQLFSGSECGKLEVIFEDDQFVAKLSGYHSENIPRELEERTHREGRAYWKIAGVHYCLIPNGNLIRTEQVDPDETLEYTWWQYQAEQTGRDTNFFKAIDLAFEAEKNILTRA
jgi:hypothetical protein